MERAEVRVGKGELSLVPGAAGGNYSQPPNDLSNQLTVVTGLGVCLNVQMTHWSVDIWENGQGLTRPLD